MLSASLRVKIFFAFLALFFIPFFVRATEQEFNIDPSYDYLARSKANAFLYQIGDNAYFYVEEEFYQTLDIDQKKEFSDSVKSLSQEFDTIIYPRLTAVFGSEWNPGIDNDPKITVLLTRIKDESGGYFNSGDEYPRIQSPDSNEKEMVYLNVNYLGTALAKGYLAHEFTHLITFNQKEKNYGVAEDVWLNEARAEAAITFLGYDKDFQGSNLQKRVKVFFQNPGDSLTEWKGLAPDYGGVNLFAQYLLDHYGIVVFADSLRSGKAGIASLNEVLAKPGFAKNFSQVFIDWLVAVSVNDCNVGTKYCYLNLNLKNLKILPKLNYLPLAGESVLTVTDYSKDWAGNWIKFIGGQGTLKLEFIGEANVSFNVPYLIRDISGNYTVNFLALNNSQQGIIYLPNFGRNYESLIIIPSAGKKTSSFGQMEQFHKFIWSTSIIGDNQPNAQDDELISKLLAQIDALKKEIAKAQAQLAVVLASNGASSCANFTQDLYFGLINNSQVRCLQSFLKAQGGEIYPEGLVTGNFGKLTMQAVIRFQEKYPLEVLAPLNLAKGTGYFGTLTRQLANKLKRA